MLRYIIIAVIVAIDLPLIFYNGYLYGRRKQLREDQAIFGTFTREMDAIFRRHEQPREPKPDYIDHQ